jgi:hypothetical protein
VGKDIRDGKLLLQALRGFGLSGCERRYVNQGSDPVVRPRVRDQGTAVRMADKDHRAADPPKATADAFYVAFQGVQAVLGADHFVPIRLQRGD